MRNNFFSHFILIKIVLDCEIMLENFNTYLTEKSGITPKELKELTSILQSKTFAKGEFLLHKGEICKYTFYVEKGLLRSYTIDEAGKEHVIQFAPEKWLISDRSSSYFSEPSEFFIDAIEDTTVVLLDKDFMDKANKLSETFRQQNERALHNHIRHLQRRIDFLLGATAEKRYLEFVRLYPDLILRVPQWMIASYLGITPEGLSRVRRELAKKNFKPIN